MLTANPNCKKSVTTTLKYDQYIDHINPDEITNIGWVKDNKAAAESIIHNFKTWIEAHKTEITTEQVQWLRMIKDYIANSFHVDRDDFEPDPFNKQGGPGEMWQIFGEETDAIIELNERLVA